MSQWIDRINDHPIWRELKSFGSSIDTAEKRDDTDINSIDGLERLRTILTFSGKRLASTDPVLINEQTLSRILSSLVNIKADVDAFSTDGIPQHIITANTRADEVIIFLPEILSPITVDDLTVIHESISSYRKTLEKHLQTALIKQQNLQVISDVNETKLRELDEKLALEQQRLSIIVLEHQSQFSTAQDKRASEFATSLTELQSRASNSLAAQQTQFSADQDERKSSYVKHQIENQGRFEAVIAEYNQKLKDKDLDFTEKLKLTNDIHEDNLKELKNNFEQKAQEILDQVNLRKNEVEKLVGVIGNLGVTSGYQKVANLARQMLFLWQGITIAALAGLIIIAYIMAFPTPKETQSATIETSYKTQSKPENQSSEKNESVSLPKANVQSELKPISESSFYQGLATRIFLSITFGIFAAYAAKQASHFLDMERKNRKLALDLEALGSYIAPLDKAQQDEFRLKIGDRSFGIYDDNTSKSKPNDPVTLINESNIKELYEVMKKILGKE